MLQLLCLSSEVLLINPLSVFAMLLLHSSDEVPDNGT